MSDQSDVTAPPSWRPDWRPTQEGLASVVFARVMHEDDEGDATFTTTSRPSLASAEKAIDRACGLLAPRLGLSLPAAWTPTGTAAAELMAALLIEPGHYPEQQRDAVEEAWKEWKQLLDMTLTALDAALKDGEDVDPGDGGGPITDGPLFRFGDAGCEPVAPDAEIPRRWHPARPWG